MAIWPKQGLDIPSKVWSHLISISCVLIAPDFLIKRSGCGSERNRTEGVSYWNVSHWFCGRRERTITPPSTGSTTSILGSTGECTTLITVSPSEPLSATFIRKEKVLGRVVALPNSCKCLKFNGLLDLAFPAKSQALSIISPPLFLFYQEVSLHLKQPRMAPVPGHPMQNILSIPSHVSSPALP